MGESNISTLETPDSPKTEQDSIQTSVPKSWQVNELDKLYKNFSQGNLLINAFLTESLLEQIHEQFPLATNEQYQDIFKKHIMDNLNSDGTQVPKPFQNQKL